MRVIAPYPLSIAIRRPAPWPLGTRTSGFESTASGSETFDLYRGRLSGLGATLGDCLESPLVLPATTDAELPGADAFFYLVGGRNAAGRGTLGFNSFRRERTPRMPCP